MERNRILGKLIMAKRMKILVRIKEGFIVKIIGVRKRNRVSLRVALKKIGARKVYGIISRISKKSSRMNRVGVKVRIRIEAKNQLK